MKKALYIIAAITGLAGACYIAHADTTDIVDSKTIDIDSSTAPDCAVFRSNDKTFQFTAKQNGTAVDLSGTTVAMQWYYTLDATGTIAAAVTLVDGGSNGVFNAKFDAADVNYAAGDYVYGVSVQDSGGNILTWQQGKFQIRKSPITTGISTTSFGEIRNYNTTTQFIGTATAGPVRAGTGLGTTTNADGSITWTVSGTGSGDVVGPSSATADDIVLFDGTTGKLIKDSGAKLSDYLTTTGDGSGLSGVVTSESDPIVGAVTGLIKADGGGNISAAVEDTDYQGVLAEGAFVDGDKTKLDGIEALADVTDETNVTAAGAGMTNAYNTWATSNLWEGDMYFDGAGYFDIDAAGNRLFIKDVEGVDVMAWSDGSRRLYDGAGNQLIVMAEAAAPVLNYVASNGMWKVNGTATNGDQIVNYSTATNLIATLAPASSLADVLAVGNDANSLAITNLASIEIDGDSITGVITNGVLELDGSEAMTGDLNMGGNLITNASDGSYTGTLATTTLVADYLPLAGGTLTGQLTAETNIVLASGSRIYIGTNMYLTTTSTSTNWTFGRLDSTNTVICPIP